MNTTVYILLAAAVILLTAGIISIYAGKTVGLYGVIETRSSIFYWIIVATYMGLGLMCLFFIFHILFKSP